MEQVYIYSMGKRLLITAIFDNDVDANAHMAKTDDAVIATFGKFVILANKYDKGLPDEQRDELLEACEDLLRVMR